jgi:hypothetical protein
MRPSQSSLWIFFPLNLMVTYYLSFLLFIIHWTFKQFQGMDWKFDNHAWCKLQASNIKNSFGLGFIMMKCLGNLCCYNDFYPLFQHSFARNEASWSGDSLQLQYLGNVLWNPQSITLAISFTIFSPPIYKLVVVECIVLFKSFQKLQSTWAPMPI